MEFLELDCRCKPCETPLVVRSKERWLYSQTKCSPVLRINGFSARKDRAVNKGR